MCGIAGIYNYGDPSRPVDRSLLERMTRLLSHRGPDAERFFVAGPVGLGHRRLAIVDLTSTGDQPMGNDDSSCWLSYNGEFYNHKDFRRTLENTFRFRGRSDTETLLRLLERDGADALTGVRGIFAFAFWNARTQSLLLARDHLGVKPLYYHDDGERIIFASEIKALVLAGTVARDIDPEAVNEYLHFNAPLGQRTFFRSIKQLLPAEYMVVDRSGLRSRRFWRITQFSTREESPAAAIAELRNNLATVVSDQLMADVPIGSFFSGGIDSSAIAAFARQAGVRPRCFGVHFADQGVIDEGPFQRAAASALNLDLDLITLDGTSFPTDLSTTLYYQDQPMIGAAMIPMYYVSKLASERVKVCLGGQAADEIFGGYARYALAEPLRVVRQWIAGFAKGGERSAARSLSGGNLRKQLLDAPTILRLARDARHIGNWRDMYFSHFAATPERAWFEVIAAREIVSRMSCYESFRRITDECSSAHPADKVMYWDVQTYLPGLFHQEDRMSMASSLESRVPFADPSLVEFAFQCDFSLKFRQGASKWILRQAVADVIPEHVLNRRKAGFDTPALRWMKDVHSDFVRDTLLSRAAVERGIVEPRGVSRLLDRPDAAPFWFDRIWKLLCIETWATVFLDQAAPKAEHQISSPAVRAVDYDENKAKASTLIAGANYVRNAVREIQELGPSATAFRSKWEFDVRSGAVKRREYLARAQVSLAIAGSEISMDKVAEAIRAVISARNVRQLENIARQASRGRLLCFGHWYGDYGMPIDWQLNPVNGRHWDSSVHWAKSLRREPAVGDVKLTWEIGRFPQAYYLVRAAAFGRDGRESFVEDLAKQISSFITSNPYPLGIHWASGQEIALRIIAWSFAFAASGAQNAMAHIDSELASALYQSGIHINAHIDYAKKAVYNNHLLSEALGLVVAAVGLQHFPERDAWLRLGLDVLTEQADRQIYRDGAYIQQSHNYHRGAIDLYLLAAHHLRRVGQRIPTEWIRALERSISFLFAHQNPDDGRLPNFGANDGSQFAILSTCDYSDFRPSLQAANILARNERLYESGPWDEMSAWLLGTDSLNAPLRPKLRSTVSFSPTGYHVLRGSDPSTFSTFRCGPIPDRFAQMDMLHLDIWWNGINILGDGGSYLYNGPKEWHGHFHGTSSHNTLQIDGHDQMVHFRRFKNLYKRDGALLQFRVEQRWVLCEGEHDAPRRYPGDCIHRRSILFDKVDTWIILDRVLGTGTHDLRLHWLGADCREVDVNDNLVVFNTARGPFYLSMLGPDGDPLPPEIVVGRNRPIRGWMSRYYGERIPVPSISTSVALQVPTYLLTILSPHRLSVSVADSRLVAMGKHRKIAFDITEGSISNISVEDVQ